VIISDAITSFCTAWSPCGSRCSWSDAGGARSGAPA